MSTRDCDIAIVGGGLSGGLIALALAKYRPELSVLLVEAGEELGGNHRWSWFSTDLAGAAEALMAPFRKTEWQGGYEVHFPAHQRVLDADYRSLASPDFAATLRREMPQETILTRRRVTALDGAGLSLEDGTRLAARTVIDCRGFVANGHLAGGWQVFMGRHLRTPSPHGVKRPLIMDATVDQTHGYRFVYVLPLGVSDLFIEDTYYQDLPQLDRSALSSRIDAYQRQHAWTGDPVGFETGVLPVITGGDFASFQASQRIPGVAMAGGRGGFVHPLTSYTLPYAVKIALAVARDADLPGDQLAAKLEAAARRHWRDTAFYRSLGRMLFHGALPEERYRIFERFYRLPQPLIERFYAGRSTLADRARVLIGKPPIPIHRGVAALLAKSSPLLSPQTKESA